jgi:hypothetical protein
MPPVFRFMTGANIYRCEASSKEEALQTIFASLNPNDDARAVILATFHEEGKEITVIDDPTLTGEIRTQGMADKSPANVEEIADRDRPKRRR